MVVKKMENVVIKSLDDKLNEFSKVRRERILAEADRLHAEYLTLQKLRKAKKFTQTQLAETLNVRQATVAQMEKRSDLLLSTLRSYVNAMGGKLSLIGNCSPPIQAPKTPQQFQSQLLCQDASFTFGYDDLRRQILILSLRL